MQNWISYGLTANLKAWCVVLLSDTMFFFSDVQMGGGRQYNGGGKKLWQIRRIESITQLLLVCIQYKERYILVHGL